MALRKINHERRIISRSLVNIRRVRPGDIIEFKYSSDDIRDRNPLVFVVRKQGKVLHGFNLNYLREFRVQKLFEEPDWKKIQEGRVTRTMRNNLFKKLRFWLFVERGYRTYTISKMSSRINEIEYKTDKMLAKERQERRDANRL